LDETELNCATTSIATTPVAAVTVATNAGYIQRVFASAAGTTTGTITVAVAVNGSSDICNSLLLVAPGTGARNGGVFEFQNCVGVGGATSPVFCSEGDVISFTASGGTGSSIAGAFGAVIRNA
jgi:hypothetical protein